MGGRERGPAQEQGRERESESEVRALAERVAAGDGTWTKAGDEKAQLVEAGWQGLVGERCFVVLEPWAVRLGVHPCPEWRVHQEGSLPSPTSSSRTSNG